MQIVKINTTLETCLGIVDDDGDVIETKPVSLEVGKLTDESIKKYLNYVDGEIAKLKSPE